ncbi:hypothetical protein [Thalassospira tepidiphila]|uniref:hypothetical protein n=1 Tax=Thalassospira tepidiphila TaxID=393657 RepID=UPI003AA97292
MGIPVPEEAVWPKNKPQAARLKLVFSAAGNCSFDGELASCDAVDEPNQRPEKSEVLQAVRSGRRAAAVILPQLRRRGVFVVANLIFTLHLIIAVLQKVISFIASKNNSC